MRFLVDEQLPPALARWLEERGHVAEHVYDAGLLGLSDLRVAQHAAETGAVIVTKDEDFRFDPARAGPVRVVWLRIGNVPNKVLLARMEAIWPRLVRSLAGDDRLIEIKARPSFPEAEER